MEIYHFFVKISTWGGVYSMLKIFRNYTGHRLWQFLSTFPAIWHTRKSTDSRSQAKILRNYITVYAHSLAPLNLSKGGLLNFDLRGGVQNRGQVAGKVFKQGTTLYAHVHRILSVTVKRRV